MKVINGGLNKEIESKKQEMLKIIKNSSGVLLIYVEDGDELFYDFGIKSNDLLGMIETVKFYLLKERFEL